MKRALCFSLLITVGLSLSVPAVADVQLLLGGDAIYCKSDQTRAFPKDGYYTLDYAMTVSEDGSEMFFPPPHWGLTQALDRISNLLSATDYKESFDRWRAQIGNNQSYGKQFIWEDSSNGKHLFNLRDEPLSWIPPENCNYSKDQEGRPVFNQAVVLKKSTSSQPSLYKRDLGLLAELEQTSILQLSMIYFHEWAWNHVSEPEMIWKANYLIHHQVVDFNSLGNELKSFGFQVQNGFKNNNGSLEASTRSTVEEDLLGPYDLEGYWRCFVKSPFSSDWFAITGDTDSPTVNIHLKKSRSYYTFTWHDTMAGFDLRYVANLKKRLSPNSLGPSKLIMSGRSDSSTIFGETITDQNLILTTLAEDFIFIDLPWKHDEVYEANYFYDRGVKPYNVTLGCMKHANAMPFNEQFKKKVKELGYSDRIQACVFNGRCEER